MNVAAVIVTRGDQDLEPVVASLPEEWEVVIWDNSREKDLSVYGRYSAIERTNAGLIYVQDDDCIVSDPEAIVDEFVEQSEVAAGDWGVDMVRPWEGVVCNQPPEFRHEFYEEHALVGFGAAFHRDAPERAFSRWDAVNPYSRLIPNDNGFDDFFARTCDIVFTALTPRVLVDVPHEDLPWAHYESRMWKQPGHLAERVRMLDLVRRLA